MAYILIDDVSYPVDTLAQIQAAEAALSEAGQEQAAVYYGADDGSGDSYLDRHPGIIYAAAPCHCEATLHVQRVGSDAERCAGCPKRSGVAANG